MYGVPCCGTRYADFSGAAGLPRSRGIASRSRLTSRAAFRGGTRHAPAHTIPVCYPDCDGLARKRATLVLANGRAGDPDGLQHLLSWWPSAGAGDAATAPAATAIAGGGQIFCHSFYSISYSTTLRNPIWTSYRLTRAMVEGADDVSRLRGKTFTLQAGLHRSLQGHHKDYLHPPYDRGHMVPANDAEDRPRQRDTFVITNAVPQTIELNQRTWRYLEASVHRIGKDDGEVFVVTGPVFPAVPQLMRKPGRTPRIAIPSHAYKAIYIPSRDIAVGYIATNDEVTVECKIVAIEELTRQTGIDPFPALPPSTKATLPAFALPQGENVDLPNCAP